MIDFVKVEDETLIKKVSVLAQEIWQEHYVPMIGKAATDYIVKNSQSFEAMKDQINNAGYSYYAFMKDNEPIGYFAIVPEGEKLFLSKFYLHKSERGNGYASKAFEFMSDYCIKNGFKAIQLITNRNNKNTIKVYLHSGFEIVEEQINDLGNGFIMEDYLMEMRVTDD